MGENTSSKQNKVSAMINTIKMISIVSAAALIFPASASAEAEIQDDTLSWYDKITVAESVSSDRPASVSFTSPKDGEDFYAVDLGVLYDVNETAHWSVGPTVEYHRNTALKQDVLSSGLKGSFLIGNVIGNVDTAEVALSLAVWTDGELKYKWDEVKDDESLILRITFTPLYIPWGLGNSFPIGNQARVQLNLSGGFVYEEATSGGDDGDALCAIVETGANVYPLYKQVGTDFELRVSNQ